MILRVCRSSDAVGKCSGFGTVKETFHTAGAGRCSFRLHQVAKLQRTIMGNNLSFFLIAIKSKQNKIHKPSCPYVTPSHHLRLHVEIDRGAPRLRRLNPTLWPEFSSQHQPSTVSIHINHR